MSDFLTGVLDPNTLNGETSGSTNLPLNIHSQAFANAIIVKTGPGILYGFMAFSSKASSQFILVFDANGVPPEGAVPATCFTIAATANLPVQWLPGRTFLTGCVLVNSSTGPTKTIGAADTFFDVQFV
jgi:hypothetical protein